MYRRYKNSALIASLFIALLLLAGCSLAGSEANKANSQSSSTGTKIAKSGATPTVIASSTVGTNKSGTGPVVIQSPTPVPGGDAGAQQLALSDRTIIIESVSKEAGNSASSSTITLKISVKNTGSKDIKNLASSYLLVGAEGDMFGLQPGLRDAFFGTVATGSTRSGTIVFQQVPSAAIKNLQLLYRSELSQSAFVPLSV